MIKRISISFLVLFVLQLFYSCKNDDAIIIKKLKQQNEFLEEQLLFSKTAIEAKVSGIRALVPYYSLYMKQDSVMRLFLNTINQISKEKVLADYYSFINQSNKCFNDAQKSNTTKLLQDDLVLTQIKTDSLLLQIPSDSLRNELIKQQILQCYLTIVQIYSNGASVCGLRYDNPNCFGFRLTIEKDTQEFLLNLKCFDPRRMPYFEKLEFISLAKNNKGDYYYSDDLTDIKTEIIESKPENDAIIIKIKPLKKGFYKIYCNKLSISDNGRIIKQPAEFDFEIN